MRANWRILREEAIKTRLPSARITLPPSPPFSIVRVYRGKKLARPGPGPIILAQKVGKSSAIQSPPRCVASPSLIRNVTKLEQPSIG